LHSLARSPRRIDLSRRGMRNGVGEDKTQLLISLWINCQACPRGAMVWGSGADKQHLSPPGDSHKSSGVLERSSQACSRHTEGRGCFSGAQTSPHWICRVSCKPSTAWCGQSHNWLHCGGKQQV